MKRNAIILAALLCAAPALAGGSFLRSVETAQKEAKEKNRLIFVDLFADWCGWCHRFEKEVVPSEKFQQATKDKVLLRVDIEDGKEGTALAHRFGITNLPTFLLLTPEMTIAGIVRGYAPPDYFVEELSKVEKEYVEFKKRVANEPALARDPQKRLDLAKEFYARHSFLQAQTRLEKLLSLKSLKTTLRDEAYYFLALSHLAQNHIDAATSTLKKLSSLQKKGETAEQGRYLLGRIYMDQKNYQAALDEFKRFKTMYPQSSLTSSVDFLIPQLENAIARAQ